MQYLLKQSKNNMYSLKNILTELSQIELRLLESSQKYNNGNVYDNDFLRKTESESLKRIQELKIEFSKFQVLNSNSKEELADYLAIDLKLKQY